MTKEFLKKQDGARRCAIATNPGPLANVEELTRQNKELQKTMESQNAERRRIVESQNKEESNS